jgi:uncharacterized protein (TIGR02186 family)
LRALGAILLWLAAAAPAAAEEVVAALSQTRVAITTSFQGSEIFIYGAIRRTAPPPEGALDVIVAVNGPSAPVIVRKKERRFGIWVNDEGVRVDAAPSFYAVASTRPLEKAVSHVEDLRHKIGLEHAVRLIGETHYERYPEDYREAVIRLREDAGLYFEDPGGVRMRAETLFSTSIDLPAQLVEGDYRARIFLLRDREVIDIDEREIAVRKVGLERWIYTMSREQSLIYGLLSIAVALAAGWLASTFFRIFFP